MVVRVHNFRAPYGAVQVEGKLFVDVIEKTVHSYFVNSGIYAIASEQLQYIPKEIFFDLPDLFGLLKSQG